MGRKKSGKPRGRSTWVKGSKLTFLESFKDEFLSSSDISAFYNKVTNNWLLRYGYDLPLEAAPHEDEELPPDGIDLLPLDEQMEERERRNGLHKTLRLVCATIYIHKLKHV